MEWESGQGSWCARCDTGRMRESEFWRLVDEEFGPGHGRMLASGHALADLDYRTAKEALGQGVPARQVWLALCREMDVPQERWLGRDIPASDHRIVE